MDEDEIKRDVESPFAADDHAPDMDNDLDDLDDDFGRSIDGTEPISTHPSMDTDVDSTERYQEGLDEVTDVDEDVEEEDVDEEEDE